MKKSEHIARSRKSSATCRLYLDVQYAPEITDPDSLAVAFDRLLETALSTPGILDDYGNPRAGEFLSASVEEPDKLRLLRELYDYMYKSVESFESEDRIGADLAYLMGAILKDSQCEWPRNRPILHFLREGCEDDHTIWNYIQMEDEA